MSSVYLTGGRATPVAEVVASLGGQVLGVVPIAQGHVTEYAAGDVLAVAEFTVPAVAPWLPRSPRDPLASYGQEVVIRRGFRLPSGETVGWQTLTRARILSAEPSDGWVQVLAQSIDARLTPARWIVNTRTSGTLHAQIRQICAGVVPVRFGFTDRSLVSRTWEQQQPRRESLLEVCDATGTVPRIIDGRLVVVDAPTSTMVTHTIRGGVGGTLTEVRPEARSAPVPNVVVASTAPEDNTSPVSAMVSVAEGPMSWTGPYGQVVEFFSSPLLTTRAQCSTAARTRLNRVQASRPDLGVSMVTDPTLRLGAVARVLDESAGTDCVVRVTEVTHALTPGREPGSMSGLVLSGTVRGESW